LKKCSSLQDESASPRIRKWAVESQLLPLHSLVIARRIAEIHL
jgi:hypothetical protein